MILTTSTSANFPHFPHFPTSFLFLLFPLLCHAILPATKSNRVVDIVPTGFLPAPWNDAGSLCHPNQSPYPSLTPSFLCDPSGLLSSHDTQALDSLLSDIFVGAKPYSLTSCPEFDVSGDTRHGFRVVLALVRKMIYDGRNLSDRTENFSQDLFRRWHMSDKCGATVLIFLSLDDRRMYLQTGKLATQYLSKKKIDKIYSKMIPLLKKNEVSRALRLGLESIAGYLSKYEGAHPMPNSVVVTPPATPTNSPAESKSQPRSNAPIFFKSGPEWWDFELSIVFALFFAFLGLACFNGFGGIAASKRKQEEKQMLRKLNMVRSEYVAAILPQYMPTTCPICHDDLTPPWSPTIPSLPENRPLTETSEPRTTRTLRCGHAFHESCFDRECPTELLTVPSCPVCGDRGGGLSTPPALSSTRGMDVEFRIERLAKEYPLLLTADVVGKLLEKSPNLWPERMTTSFLSAEAERGRNI